MAARAETGEHDPLRVVTETPRRALQPRQRLRHVLYCCGKGMRGRQAAAHQRHRHTVGDQRARRGLEDAGLLRNAPGNGVHERDQGRALHRGGGQMEVERPAPSGMLAWRLRVGYIAEPLLGRSR